MPPCEGERDTLPSRRTGDDSGQAGFKKCYHLHSLKYFQSYFRYCYLVIL